MANLCLEALTGVRDYLLDGDGIKGRWRKSRGET